MCYRWCVFDCPQATVISFLRDNHFPEEIIFMILQQCTKKILNCIRVYENGRLLSVCCEV